MFVFCFFFLLATFSTLFAQNQILKPSDYYFQPYKEEGYFQGWNYSFLNSEFQIFVTALISNLGPNSFNNGVSISIESPKTGSYFKTKEYGEKDLVALQDRYYIKLLNNEFMQTGNSFEIKVYADEVKLYLKYENLFSGMPLSKGNYTIEKNYFVRADIPFSYSKATGYLDFKGNVYTLEGVGGLEHLLTNYEVYKFSKRWEMLRSISKNRVRFFTGGFHSKEEGGNYRMIAIQDKSGKLIFFDKVLSSEILLEKKESFSGYLLPYKERLYTNESKDCSFLIEYSHNAGRINVLENISTILRIFIRLFFANPYILNFHVKVSSDCPSKFPVAIEWIGVKSDYLVNPK